MPNRFELITQVGNHINCYATVYEIISGKEIPEMAQELIRKDSYVVCLASLENSFKLYDLFGFDYIHSNYKLNRNRFYIGTWECEKSLFKFCVYDDKEDSAHDFCLFCSHPEERK